MPYRNLHAFGYSLEDENGCNAVEEILLKATTSADHIDGPQLAFLQQISMLGENYRAYGHSLIEQAAAGHVILPKELATLERIEYLYMLGTSSTENVRAFRTANLQQGKDMFSGVGPSLSESIRKLSGIDRDKDGSERFHIDTGHGIGRTHH